MISEGEAELNYVRLMPDPALLRAVRPVRSVTHHNCRFLLARQRTMGFVRRSETTRQPFLEWFSQKSLPSRAQSIWTGALSTCLAKGSHPSASLPQTVRLHCRSRDPYGRAADGCRAPCHPLVRSLRVAVPAFDTLPMSVVFHPPTVAPG